MALRVPRFPAFLVVPPDLVWDVLATGNHDFMKGPTMQVSKPLLGEGLLTSEGAVHQRQRRSIQPIFHHERIDAYGDEMVGLAASHADRWSAGDVIDVHRAMAGLTLAIVGRTLFATDVESTEAQEISNALTDVLAQFNRVFSPFLPLTQRLPLPSTKRFNHARAVFDQTIHAMIDERRRSEMAGTDLLSLLLRAHDGDAGMSDTQVRDQAITLFLAGHETTSNALTFTWYLLSEHPDAESALHSEVDAVLGGRLPTVADVPQLPVTRAALAEAMRLYPPAWAIGRRCLIDHRLGEHVLPAGSVIVVSPWLLHHDERWWPQPAAFRLDRWTEEAQAIRPRHAYLPFGGGPRMCIGEGFAWMEGVLLLATIAQRWRFELEPSQTVALQPVVTLRPRHGMRMRVMTRA